MSLNLRRSILSAILTLGLTFFGTIAHAAKPTSPLEVKTQSLSYLQSLRAENIKKLHEIDSTLRNKVENGHTKDLDQEIKALQANRQEHLLRQEFLNRLIFQIDTNFKGQDLRAFLGQALKKMAADDLLSGAKSDGLWKFLRYSAEAVNRLPQQDEDVLSFLEGYMKTSVGHPEDPDKYMAQRNYTNGTTSEAGAPLNRDEVGAYAARRLHQLSLKGLIPTEKKTR